MGVQPDIPPRPPLEGLRPEFPSRDEFAFAYYTDTPVSYLPKHLLSISGVPWWFLTPAQPCREREAPGPDPLVVLLPRRPPPVRSRRCTSPVVVVVVSRARARRLVVARAHLLPGLLRTGYRRL